MYINVHLKKVAKMYIECTQGTSLDVRKYIIRNFVNKKKKYAKIRLKAHR